MRMGIDETCTKDTCIELYTSCRVEPIGVLLYGNDFVATIGKAPNRYERSWLKPLWSQQIV